MVSTAVVRSLADDYPDRERIVEGSEALLLSDYGCCLINFLLPRTNSDQIRVIAPLFAIVSPRSLGADIVIGMDIISQGIFCVKPAGEKRIKLSFSLRTDNPPRRLGYLQ